MWEKSKVTAKTDRCLFHDVRTVQTRWCLIFFVQKIGMKGPICERLVINYLKVASKYAYSKFNVLVEEQFYTKCSKSMKTF